MNGLPTPFFQEKAWYRICWKSRTFPGVPIHARPRGKYRRRSPAMGKLDCGQLFYVLSSRTVLGKNRIPEHHVRIMAGELIGYIVVNPNDAAFLFEPVNLETVG